MSGPEIHVTDHALVRYIERALNIDIERTCQMIREQVKAGVATGATKVKTSDVVTVMSPIDGGGRHRRKRR